MHPFCFYKPNNMNMPVLVNVPNLCKIKSRHTLSFKKCLNIFALWGLDYIHATFIFRIVRFKS